MKAVYAALICQQWSSL